jgi:hypothetical protein
MPGPDLLRLDRYAAAMPERPASFAERGVAVPFTAPMLAAARLRRLPDRLPELLLPALGGRGVYILGWEACFGLCAPTLHDRQLWDRLAALARPTPASVRAAARAAALTGIAGRPAAAAARIADAMEPGSAMAARLRAIEAAAAALEGWAAAAADPADRRAALLVAGTARLALAAAAANAQGPAERPDWLLDGWDRIAAIWAEAPVADRRAALHDILVALPIPPREAEAWPGPPAEWDALLRAARLLSPRPSWAGGGRVALVARNEAVRALAA